MLHKKSMRFMMSLAVFILTVSLVLPALSFAKDTELSVLISQATYKDAHRKMADKIEGMMDVKVDFQVIPDDQFYNLMKTKMATKEVPDILVHNVPSGYYVIRAQDTCVNMNDQPWAARMANPGFVKDDKGDIYAMPEQTGGAFVAAYYNKKVFDELGLTEPSTYAEFLDVLEAAKQAGVIPFFAANKDSWTTQIYMTNGFPVMVTKKDPEIWNKLKTNQLKFADVPEFEMILSDYLELYTKGYVNKDHMSATYDDSKEAVATGKALMLLNGEWAANDIRANYPDVELGSFIIPYRDQQLISIGKFVKGYSVPKGSGKEEVALEFLNKMSQPDIFNMFFAENAGYPSMKDVDGGNTVPAVRELVEEYVNTDKYVYEMNAEIQEAGPIFPELWKFYQDMVTGGMSPKEVLEAWDAKLADFMKSKGEAGW